MRLCSEIVNLIGLNFGNDPCDVGRVSQIAIMQSETCIINMWIFIDMVDALGVERRRTPLNAMDFNALFKQKFSKIRPVLASYPSN